MTIKCANCGQMVPKDNAKFCNSCGAALPPPPHNSQQGAARAPLTNQPGGVKGAPRLHRSPDAAAPLGASTRPDLYEQIAQQPPSRPPGTGRSIPNTPPAWMRTLDRQVRPGKLPQRDAASQRELPVSQGSPTFSEEDTISPDESPVFVEDSVEDLPTAHMQTSIPEPPTQETPGPAGHATNRTSRVWDSSPDDVTQLATNRLASQRQIKPGDPLGPQGVTQPPAPHPMPLGAVIFQNPPLTPQTGARELKDAAQADGINRAAPSPGLRPPFQAASPMQEGGQAGVVPQSHLPVSIVTKPVSRQGRSRKRLALVLALLVVLLAGGIAAWLIVVKPFSVASITQPWQQFCDPGLGVSGQYPTGWTKQVDSNKAVHFSDGTDQFSIVAVAANGQDAATYLRKEAAQLGITGLKPGASASFAGTSWQQAQGSLLESQTGVTYTEALLVTAHGGRFFTIVQIAPPGTYNEEDVTIFSGMRSSFQFSNSCP